MSSAGRSEPGTSRSRSCCELDLDGQARGGLDDVVGVEQDAGVLRPADTLGEVAQGMGDDQDGATGRRGPHRGCERRPPLRARQVQVHEQHEVGCRPATRRPGIDQ